MKLRQITRAVQLGSLAANYILGEVPLTFSGATMDLPAVKSIKLLIGGVHDAHRDVCYLVTFVDSEIRHIVPAKDVYHVEYENEPAQKENKKSKKQKVAIAASEDAELADMSDDAVEVAEPEAPLTEEID